MKSGILIVLGWSSALCLSVTALRAQETKNDVELLQRQLEEMRANFDRVQREQRQQIEALQKQLERLQVQGATVSGTGTLAAVQWAEEPPPKTDLGKPWSPADPIRFGRGPSYLNLSFDALFAAGSSTAEDIEDLQLGGHDPSQRGFTIQNVEAVFDGAVDPYFRGQGNVIFFLDSEGETQVELEEAYLESLSLPANLQLKSGQYFTEFGRHNPTHPHTWSFVDAPLINGRFLGPDGLRNPGARLSWLMPTPFYSEFYLGAQNSQGETATSFRSAGGHAHGGEEEEEEPPFAYRHPDNDRGLEHLDDLLFTARYATSFDITDAQTLLFGASAALGPNSRGGEDAGGTDTQIYGADLTWKWKSPRHSGGFPFVLWQTEAMLRRYDAGAFDWSEEANEGSLPIIDEATDSPAALDGETLTDHGFYSQLLYGFRKGWVAGLRVDYVAGGRADYEKLDLSFDGEPLGRDPQRNQRWRLSPNLTWYPSEFSKIRLQYNYDDRRDIGVDHSVWLQFEFLLGTHGAHKF